MRDKLFGPYRILDLLGEGGMGEVWRAEDTRKKRVVALKVLKGALNGESQADRSPEEQIAIERFEREAFAIGSLQNPNIVPVHDYGIISGHFYIEMALVSGVSLANLLRDHGPMSADRSLRIIVQVARALDYAHSSRILHRDIKPSNLLICEIDGDDFVYLIDFGIARSEDYKTITKQGDAIGTARYMAPERFQGEGGVASDVYALTCVLFEMLTGKPAFRGESYEQLVHAHIIAERPKLKAHLQNVSLQLEAVIARGLDKDPSRRFVSAGELAKAAGSAVSGRPQAPGQARRSPRAAKSWGSSSDEVAAVVTRNLNVRSGIAHLSANSSSNLIGLVDLTNMVQIIDEHRNEVLTVIVPAIDQQPSAIAITEKDAVLGNSDGTVERWRSFDSRLRKFMPTWSAGGGVRRVAAWSSNTNHPGVRVGIHGDSSATVSSVASLPDGRVIGGRLDGKLCITSSENSRTVIVLPTAFNNRIQSLALDPSGQGLVAALDLGTIAYWTKLPPDLGVRCILREEAHWGRIHSVGTWNEYLTTIGDDHKLRLWRVGSSGPEIHAELPLHRLGIGNLHTPRFTFPSEGGNSRTRGISVVEWNSSGNVRWHTIRKETMDTLP